MKHPRLFTCILALCLVVPAAGQGPVRDFRYAKEANPQLDFGNAAYLSTLEGVGFSEAVGTVTKENGAIIPIEGSPDSWQAGIETGAFRRVSERLVFSGKLSYSYFKGARMGAQILMHPSANLLNFLEEDDATLGDKKREIYSMMGGLSYSLGDRCSVGLRVDYMAADQTKYKDPRFSNVLMDLQLAPGILFHGSDAFSFGGNFIYRHSLEQLSGGVFGTKDRQYFILVDQGGFLGSREIFEGDIGYVSVSNARPLSLDQYGLSLQTVVGSHHRFYGQFEGLWHNGYYGSRTSTSVVFCEFRGPEVRFNGLMTLPSGNDLHRIELSAGASFLSKLTNIYSYKSETGMTTTVEYHGQNETLTRSDFEARLAYTLEKGLGGYRPEWVLCVSADAFLRDQRTAIYPDYRDHNYWNLTLALSAERNFKRSSDCISIAAQTLFAAGAGNDKVDGSYSSEGASKLRSFDDWLFRQFEYDTASRVGAELSFTWTSLRPKRLAPYVKVSDRFVSLLSEPQYLGGRTRNVASLSLGINF